jgi:hypothetical protein
MFDTYLRPDTSLAREDYKKPEINLISFQAPKGDYLFIEYLESDINDLSHAVAWPELAHIHLTLIPVINNSHLVYLGWFIFNSSDTFSMSGIDLKESWEPDYYDALYDLERLKTDFQYYIIARQRMLGTLKKDLLKFQADKRSKALKLKNKLEQELEEINHYHDTHDDGIEAVIKI